VSWEWWKNYTPSGKTFPWIRIIKRKKKRIPAEIAEDYQIGTLMGDGDAYDNENFINETAKLIGGAILDDGEIIRLWKTGGL